MSIIEWEALEQKDAWLGRVGLSDICAVLATAEPKWPWQVQDRSGMLREATLPARSFEEACWLAENDVIAFIQSHDLVPTDPDKAAALTFDRSRSNAARSRSLEYWDWRDASGWDDLPDLAA